MPEWRPGAQTDILVVGSLTSCIAACEAAAGCGADPTKLRLDGCVEYCIQHYYAVTTVVQLVRHFGRDEENWAIQRQGLIRLASASSHVRLKGCRQVVPKDEWDTTQDTYVVSYLFVCQLTQPQ